jgi:hypothetical protein
MARGLGKCDVLPAVPGLRRKEATVVGFFGSFIGLAKIGDGAALPALQEAASGDTVRVRHARKRAILLVREREGKQPLREKES